jgi:hypothetical protein
MESNKPFKTISLEQRLAQSVMGEFNPEKNKPALQSTIQNLKEANTSFPKTIRLENRTAQPLDSRTTHLAKYFVSDTYTGVLKATPFVTSPLASRVLIDPYGFVDKGAITFHRDLDPKKGSPILRNIQTPTQPTDTQSDQITIKGVRGLGSILVSQGTSVSNDTFTSITQIKQSRPEEIVLITQGTVVSNNIYRSVAETKNSVIPELINQGSVEVKKTLGIIDVAVLQGLLLNKREIVASYIETDKLDPIPTIIRGVRRFPKSPAIFELTDPKIKEQTSPAVNETGQPQQPTNSYKLFAPILQNVDTDLGVLKKELVGYGSVALPFNYTPSPYYSPTLKVANYELDRLLARFVPTVKHGSSAVIAFNPDIRQGSTEVDQADLAQTPQKGPYKSFKNTGTFIGFLDAVGQAGQQPTIPVYQETAIAGFGNVNRQVWSSIVQALAAGDSLPTDNLTNFPSGQTSLGSLSRYKALSYGEIETSGSAAAANAGRSSKPGALGIVNPQIGSGNRTIQNVPDYTGKDYITIKIASDTLGTNVVFKAYLTSFSDSFSTSWNDVQYVGRQETLKQFKGVTRAVSFGLSVPSFSKVDLPINMAKIQKAINITSIGTYSGNYIKGPLCKLTLGGFFKNVYVVFNSFKVDFDPAESTWDIDKGLPHLLKISMDAAVLGDAANKGLDAKSSIHYNA